MIELEKIILNRAEGPIPSCNEDVACGSFAEADAQLRRWSETAPSDYGYDKVDVTLSFVDGYAYHGRYDLKHWSIKRPDLRREIACHLEMVAGRAKPLSWKRWNYRRWLLRHREHQAWAIDFLDRYRIGDAA